MPRDKLIQVRRGTTSAWTEANPILEEGELGYDTNSGSLKVGDGSTAWLSLSGISGGGGQGPAGQDGTDGASAYEIAVTNGFVGTEVDWLASLEGADGVDGQNGQDGQDGVNGTNGTNGTDGADGDSAYQVWINAGNSGTEQDFLDSLVGAQGPAGADGQDGAQGVQGEVGPAGSDGAQGPQGVKGDTGDTGPQGPAGADADLGNIGKSFSAYNNSQQTTNSTSFVDVTGWTEDAGTDDVFSFNETTGVLTVTHTGKIILTGNITLEQTTGNNRAVPRFRACKGTAQIEGMRAEGYTRQTGTGDRQALSFIKPVAVTTGDTFKLQISTHNTLYTHRIVSGTCSFSATVIS